MSCRGMNFPKINLWSACVVVACCTGALASHELDDPGFATVAKRMRPDVDHIEEEVLSGFLPPIERALQGIRRRAAGDRTLKRLAEEPIVPIDYVNGRGEARGYRRSISAPTDDQIEINTNNLSVRIRRPGSVAVHIEVSGREIQEVNSDGLYHGTVTWRTNNQHVFVKLFWCTEDSGLPDRFLAVVREELEREGLRLLPMQKRDWPIAVTSQRLSQLLPPGNLPPLAPPPKGEVASLQSSVRVFASPFDVVAAYNQAVARKDWQAYARCLAPASQGAVVREMVFLAMTGGKKCPGLIKAIEKHLGFKLIDASNFPGSFVESREAEEFLQSLGDQPGEDLESANNRLYETFRKRVGDVPAFLDDCFPELQRSPEGHGKPIECEGIRVGGDKASGYWIDRCPAPNPKEAEERDVLHYLPRYFPVKFRRINGSWSILN